MAVLASSPAAAATEEQDPAQWPTGAGTDPGLSTTAHTIRFGGPDRYQTNLATSLALRGDGDYPFDTPDRTGGGIAELAAAHDWWGAATCPYAVLVVAGDTFADSLAAASLSDPTNRSQEPRVQRVAAADPLFDPVGGFDRVDTDGAPIVVTRSAREGATGLGAAARLTLTDLAAGGCSTAREAIIVGGEAAIPAGVASELLSLGYEEVFRVAGTDRYGTAAAVAQALGTSAPPPEGSGCLDGDSSDGGVAMGFYANATAEFRPTSTSCRLLTRSVVLAEGGTGADALAAGWWTSYWQVPVLLVAPDGSLPPATRSALQTIPIDNVIVLGGTGRIPESTVLEAGSLASAAVGRIAGSDRYATSAEMARVFGGWWPSTGAAGGRRSVVCIAASAGDGAMARGWPDALAAGPWCGRLSAGSVGPPRRALPPIHGEHALAHDTDGSRAHMAVPILLVPAGEASVPPAVRATLESAFDPTRTWCTSLVEPGGCLEPGFGVAFGGSGVVSESVLLSIARAVSGGRYSGLGDLVPSLAVGFVTGLDLSPVFRQVGEATVDRLCYSAGALGDVRWIARWADAGRRQLVGAVDVVAARAYAGDGSGSIPLCGPIDVSNDDSTVVTGVSLSGKVTVGERLVPAERLVLTRDVVLTGGTVAGDEGVLTWMWDGAPAAEVRVELGGFRRRVRSATIEVVLNLPSGGIGPATFTGQVELVTDEGTVAGAVSGAALQGDEGWLLRGRFSGSISADKVSGDLTGGFVADADPDTDRVSWRIDGLLAP